MTAAEGAAPLPIRGRAALVVATLGLAASGCRPTPVEALVLPNLTDDRWSGETLDLAVQGTTAGFEFRFWVHEDGAWTVRREYAAEPGFRFAPTSHGLRSFQVDVRRTGAAEPLRQHWIGQKFVGPRDASSPLLRDVLLAPPALRLPLGSRVAIYARPNAPLTLDDLECRVLDSETPLGAWRNWPPEPLVLDRPGESRFALQVRQRGQTAIETHTLGPLQALEEQDSPSLFRLCAAELPTTLPESEAWATLAVRLAIAHHAMANEHDAGDDEALITRLRGVARVDATGTPWTLTPSRGAALHFDPRARSLRTANGPQSIDLHVATWPGHRELLATTRGFAEPSRLCADLAFAVFGAYRYGTPPAGPALRMHGSVGSCATTTAALVALLQALDLQAEHCYLDDDGAAHALALCRPAPGDTLILDTSEGLLYRWDLARGGHEAPPAPMAFPGRRELGLELARRFSPARTRVLAAPRLRLAIPPELDVASRRVVYQPAQ